MARSLLLLLALTSLPLASLATSSVDNHHDNEPCEPYGDEHCSNGEKYPKYKCSPPITKPETSAILTSSDFTKDGDRGHPSECEKKYYEKPEKVVAISTGWYDKGSLCGKMIKITSKKTRRSTMAKVVDECDSRDGCDKEHAGKPPCRNNVIDASKPVWDDLKLTPPGPPGGPPGGPPLPRDEEITWVEI